MRLTEGELFDRVKRKTINAAADVDAFLPAPGVGVCYVIVGFMINCPGGVNTVTFLSGATVGAGVAIEGLPPLEFVDSGGMVNTAGFPIAELAGNAAISIDLGSATQVTGALYYVLAPV